jgi:hypothetical protein
MSQFTLSIGCPGAARARVEGRGEAVSAARAAAQADPAPAPVTAQPATRPRAAAGLAPAESQSKALVLPFWAWLALAASALVGLIVTALGLALPSEPPGRQGEPVEERIIESDLGEPFVVCTTQAGVTRCRNLAPPSNRP